MPTMKVARPIEMTQEFLLQIFEYEQQSGVLRWKSRPDSMFERSCAARSWNSRFAGKPAGSVLRKPRGTPYVQVGIGKRTLKAHRIIWALIHGDISDSLVIDHVNGNGLDNRISNLRLVTPQENSKNGSLQRRNSSGVAGVYWNSHEQKWHARIQVDGVRKSIGQYDSIEDARDARKAHQAAQNYHPLHGMPREARALSS